MFRALFDAEEDEPWPTPQLPVQLPLAAAEVPKMSYREPMNHAAASYVQASYVQASYVPATPAAQPAAAQREPWKPLPPDLPAERYRVTGGNAQPWRTSAADTINAVLSGQVHSVAPAQAIRDPQLPGPWGLASGIGGAQQRQTQQQAQRQALGAITPTYTVPKRGTAPASYPISRPKAVQKTIAGLQRKEVPYIPQYEAYIYICSAAAPQGQGRTLWQRAIVSHTRQFRDILSALGPLLGGPGSVEVIFIARLTTPDGAPHTFTFADNLGIHAAIDGYPLPAGVPVTIFPTDQTLMVRWSQATNNNYTMELSAMPHPLPLTWLWSTQEQSAPMLHFSAFDRERGPPSRRRRAVIFEEFRQPDLFLLQGAGTTAIADKVTPLIPTRTKYLQLKGRESGLTCTVGVAGTAWTTITILFYVDQMPRPTEAGSLHRFFSQGPFTFGLEYLVAGTAGYGAAEGIYLRGQVGDGRVTYAQNRLQRDCWYLLVVAFRGTNLSFGAYPVAAGTAEERLAVTVQRGVITDVAEYFGGLGQGQAEGSQMHIGYGFRGLIGWIHYFDKYCNFEAALEAEFTDSWAADWHA